MDLQQRFESELPGAFFVEETTEPAVLGDFLKQKGLLPEDEQVMGLEKPGEGNMNLVLRVQTDQRTFILKQSRPWVQKFPQIVAPADRIHGEAAFYQAVGNDPAIARYMPKLLGFDAANFLLLEEDLGESADFTFLYKRKIALSDMETFQLLDFLNALHHFEAKPNQFPENRAMRDLNHQHIFLFPYMQDNGLNLDQVQEGLEEVALSLKTNTVLSSKATALGEVYLTTGETLIQGDYYPGSWLKVDEGVRVIDPEFGYVGKAEFDLGVWMAHMFMAGEPEDKTASILDGYDALAFFDRLMMWQFCGIEIIRRLIGLAQLPLSLSLEEKEKLLQQAENMVLYPQKVEG